MCRLFGVKARRLYVPLAQWRPAAGQVFPSFMEPLQIGYSFFIDYGANWKHWVFWSPRKLSVTQRFGGRKEEQSP